jgi:tRNA pseudouridine13 synthase
MPGGLYSLPDWNRVSGPPGSHGLLRVEVEDFRVEELPLITPEGEGSHLWLEVEKRNANTDWVARQLATLAGVSGRDIGFAGMKDRRGVTTQWFSIALQEAADASWENWEVPDADILQAHLHGRKLKRGTLRGNRFRIVVRQLEGQLDDLEDRLQRVSRQGVPNYFGPQRFGHGGRNVAQGVRWLERGGRLPRNKKSIYLSSVRSFLFNQVLSRRVSLGNWNRIVDGDIASLDGSRSTFPCPMPDPELNRRCEEFDIHPSGPLPGGNGKQAEREAAEIEQNVLEPYEDLIDNMARTGLKAARRALRLAPNGMEWKRDSSNLILKFELPPGSYATSVLLELVTTDPVSISEIK